MNKKDEKLDAVINHQVAGPWREKFLGGLDPMAIPLVELDRMIAETKGAPLRNFLHGVLYARASMTQANKRS